MDRLNAGDASFLYAEDATMPMHVGGVFVVRPPRGGFDFDRFVELIVDRLSLAPRYRQRIATVPAKLANPVWIDDEEFDIGYHVRRSALPAPGSSKQLAELVSRLMSRRLDRSRPLWEIYLVEGLPRGRVAIITKAHHALVDGVRTFDISEILLDTSSIPEKRLLTEWHPRKTPSHIELLAASMRDYARRPRTVLDTWRAGISDAKTTSKRLAEIAGSIVTTARKVAQPPSASPLNVPIGAQRRFAMTCTKLDDYKIVSHRQKCSVNDVALATISGALRTWLMARGEAVRTSTTLRAMLPVSVRPSARSAVGPADGLATIFVDLPIGEPNALVRLSQIAYATAGHRESEQAISARTLVSLTEFAPPTVHSLAAQVTQGLTKRVYNLVITNVPGPQHPLYASGGRLVEMYPVVSLAKSQALAIGLTSYDGTVCFGLNADRDAMGDVDALSQMIEESLAELVGLCE
ncbi:WS/DGAT/MGAT family acyltransferase [Antricoccus suffuscus]|uniref:Diacylglycerol O-acyltransferase n=1 Tax=Antricoccus suffuscus TaxID=1629062 RepID=A0A2T0ZQE3_9ACTN|nr:wax ester/triacylglycerol synthase family O-acyltransferase [Antricoccus suffuscus]PRZ38579.1 WS/DGAT/MGAT family acyltransferase [Antricoccus suffuscus]